MKNKKTNYEKQCELHILNLCLAMNDSLRSIKYHQENVKMLKKAIRLAKLKR
jgi:hypothetical protein